MAILRPLLGEAKGFIAHGAGMSPEGRRVYEIWDTQQDATSFFAKIIHPNLPPGVTPNVHTSTCIRWLCSHKNACEMNANVEAVGEALSEANARANATGTLAGRHLGRAISR